MKKRIAVLTEDVYLYQKIYLLLSPVHECERVFGVRADGYDLCLFDARDGGKAPEGTPVIIMSYSDAKLKIPFSEEELLSAVENTEKPPELSLGDGCAYFRGKAVKLSNLEYSLLSLLISMGGRFVSREEILKEVWHSEKEGGIVNVYVHYLREKLEACGEKVIISSRKEGYKIDGRFLLREEGVESPVSN